MLGRLLMIRLVLRASTGRHCLLWRGRLGLRGANCHLKGIIILYRARSLLLYLLQRTSTHSHRRGNGARLVRRRLGIILRPFKIMFCLRVALLAHYLPFAHKDAFITYTCIQIGILLRERIARQAPLVFLLPH